MTKPKKKLSKKAKAALKILEESKLLENSKSISGSKTEPGFKPVSPSIKTAKAHKARPSKKRA